MKLTFNDSLFLCILLLLIGGAKAHALSTTTTSDNRVVIKDSGDIVSVKQPIDSVRLDAQR